MSHFALIVTLRVKPGWMEEFLPLILENQRLTRQNESGCRRFDVYRSNEEDNTLFFVEEYDDPDTFKVHQNSEHFKTYFEAAKNMMAERIWQRCTLIDD
jgi:quinol monooxygenase YgiN